VSRSEQADKALEAGTTKFCFFLKKNSQKKAV
jgi:hypothetical protein